MHNNAARGTPQSFKFVISNNSLCPHSLRQGSTKFINMPKSHSPFAWSLCCFSRPFTTKPQSEILDLTIFSYPTLGALYSTSFLHVGTLTEESKTHEHHTRLKTSIPRVSGQKATDGQVLDGFRGALALATLVLARPAQCGNLVPVQLHPTHKVPAITIFARLQVGLFA